jgi:hypothetical protein
VVLILIDRQQKLFDYGGTHRLDALPHVRASISDSTQVDTVLERLKDLCAELSNRNNTREIFLIFDNFEDLIEELDTNQVKELVRLIRRYGRSGLHVVVSSTQTQHTSELWRAIKSANFGIGLRTLDAVQALAGGLRRTPAELSDNKELPVGRGYLIKSSHPALLQVATPYGSNGHGSTADETEYEEEQQAQMLDWWVQHIQARYPTEQDCWTSDNGAATAQGSAVIAQANPLIGQMQALLRQGLRREIEQVAGGNGADTLPLARKVHTDDMDWNSEDMLMNLLQELWILLQTVAPTGDDDKERFLQNLAELLSEPTTK